MKKSRKDNRRKADPVVTEIVRNGVLAVTEEMKTNLMRTAYNIIIYEALDFTTGLFTPQGETISIGIGLPMFIRGMAETVKAKIRHFGLDDIRPGDIYVTNDSYLTGSHLNHVTLTLPIFHKRELVAFSCCMAHWLDIGGTLGGMTHRHLFGRAADSDPEVSGPRRGQPDGGRVHQAERAAAEPGDGRSARPGDGGEDRRAALSATDRALRARRGALVDQRYHGQRRDAGARAHAHDPGRHLRGRVLHGRRRHRHRQARCRSACASSSRATR